MNHFGSINFNDMKRSSYYFIYKKTGIIIFVSLVLATATLCQNAVDNRQDSLLNVLKNPDLHDTSRIRIYVNFGTQYFLKNEIQESKAYFSKAETVAFKLDDPNYTALVYNRMAATLNNKDDLDQLMDKAMNLFPRIPEMDSKGVDRLIRISLSLEQNEEFVKAINYLAKLEFHLNKHDSSEKLHSFLNMVKEEIYSFLGDHTKAVFYAERAIAYAEKSRDSNQVREANFTLGYAYLRSKRYDKMLEVYSKMYADSFSLKVYQRVEIASLMVEALDNLKEYEEALKLSNKYLENEEIKKEWNYHIMHAKLLWKTGNVQKALDGFNVLESKIKQSSSEEQNIEYHLANLYISKSELLNHVGKIEQAIPILKQAVVVYRSYSATHFRDDFYWKALEMLIKGLEKTGDIKEVASFQKELLSSMKHAFEDEAMLKASLALARQEEEKQHTELALLEQKNQQQRRFLWSIGAALVVVLGLGGIIFRQSKSLSHEKKKSEALLLNMLPDTIANRMKLGEHSIADYFEEATVVFIDMVGFTSFAKDVNPREVVQLLNTVFSKIDRLTGQFGLEKIKTIGDCYMAVSGIPVASKDHLEKALLFCNTVLTEVDGLEFLGREIQFKIGVETGPAVAGIIGEKRFLFDLWGDTVNTASRMESNGIPGAIQVTANVQEKMKDRFAFESRGQVEIKGKGVTEVFLLRKVK